MEEYMEDELIKKLRKSKQKNRKNIAMQLAKIGSEKALQELIRMVEGEKRGRILRYNLNDQLIGIEALGETGKEEALKYLKKLYENETIIKKHEYTHEYARPMEGEIEIVRFPNAKRGLKEALGYIIFYQYWDQHEIDPWRNMGYFLMDYSKDDIGYERKQILDSLAHKTIRMAIEKLENKLK